MFWQIVSHCCSAYTISAVTEIPDSRLCLPWTNHLVDCGTSPCSTRRISRAKAPRVVVSLAEFVSPHSCENNFSLGWVLRPGLLSFHLLISPACIYTLPSSQLPPCFCFACWKFISLKSIRPQVPACVCRFSVYTDVYNCARFMQLSLLGGKHKFYLHVWNWMINFIVERLPKSLLSRFFGMILFISLWSYILLNLSRA